MNDFAALADLEEVLAAKRTNPTITLWNRLEGRPRRHDFDRALQAEVRDALWMLTRQWQMGEFRGDDAGSPIKAKVHIETTQLTKYRAADHAVEAFDNEAPLEARVERRPIPFELAGTPVALDIRAEMGRRWLRLIRGIEDELEQRFIQAEELSFQTPNPEDRAQAATAAHRESLQEASALAGRALDGYRLYQYLSGPGTPHAHDLVSLDQPGSVQAIEDAETVFLDWYRRLFHQPTEDAANAWLPQRLEYAFATAAPQDGGEKTLLTDEYFHGHLDWYNLDNAPAGESLEDVPGAPAPEAVQGEHTASFVPTPIRFDGMPHTRWWTFEDGNTNFGDLDPDTTEIAKLLVMEFGLVYANDWFLLPFEVPAGSLARVRGLTVSNVFGERLWLSAAGQGADSDWQRWSMFNLTNRGGDALPADQDLLILPSVPKIQEGRPMEAVELVRDEVANMVWGIETRVPLPHGESLQGRRAARETRRYHKRLVEATGMEEETDPGLLDNDAGIRYRVMSRVPENWIPFIPVHVPNANREIQLRRAAMPRLIDGDPETPVPVEPRTALLRHGLDAEEPSGYDLHEEEVPRAGIRVTQSFQRARWYGGEVFLWLGARKTTGRGEKSGRLSFDRTPRKRR